MGGGHAPGARRRATSEFPAGWSHERILRAVVDVAGHPDQPPRRQANGRWWAVGTRDGVEIEVLIEQDGRVTTAYPVRGRGVTRNPDRAHDPANPTVADVAAGRISYFAGGLLDRLHGRLPYDDLTHYRRLLWAGEWEELVDVLAAHIDTGAVPLTVDEHADFERLLNTYDIPLTGFAFINDRRRILESMRGR
jgi:hypothetical protein